MTEFIDANGGLIATIVVVVMALNALILGLHKGLELIKDKTKTDADNKLHAATTKIVSVAQKILELLAAYKPKEEKK